MILIAGISLGLSRLPSAAAGGGAASFTYLAGDAYSGSFARNSIATQRTGGVGGLLATVSANELRDNHYVWHPGESKWVRTTLIEPLRVNPNANTTNLALAEWSGTGATQVGNQPGAPDGTNTYAFLRESTNTGNHFQTRNITLAGDTKHTFSAWFKKSVVGGRNLRIGFTGNSGSEWVSTNLPNIFIDLTTGAVVQNNGFETPILEDWGTSWRICATTASKTVPSPTTPLRSWNIIIANGTNISYTGDNVSGWSWWGPQSETAPYATSYKPVPTALGVDQTREADLFTINDPGISGAWTQTAEYFDLATNAWKTETTTGSGAADILFVQGRAYRSLTRTKN